MLVNILSLIHNTTTLLFGVYASAAFLGIRMNRKNILSLLTFSCITGVFMRFLLYCMEPVSRNRSILSLFTFRLYCFLLFITNIKWPTPFWLF